MALGVALVATGALATTWLVGQAGDRVAVVVVARPVAYGTQIAPGDLAITEVSVEPGVSTVPATALSTLVGQVAAVPLLAGTLMSPDWVATASPPGAGEVLVGVALPATRLPAGPLSAGDRVRVVSTPPQDADPSTLEPPTIVGTVVRFGEPDLDGVAVVDLAVPPRDGPMLAAWSATGRVALVLEPRGVA